MKRKICKILQNAKYCKMQYFALEKRQETDYMFVGFVEELYEVKRSS